MVASSRNYHQTVFHSKTCHLRILISLAAAPFIYGARVIFLSRFFFYCFYFSGFLHGEPFSPGSISILILLKMLCGA